MTDAIMLKNVRLSFPHLFRKSVYEGTEGDYDATLILDKPDKEHKKLGAQLVKVTNGLVKSELKGKKPKVQYMAFKDDANREAMDNNRPEYEGCYTLKAKNKARPVVIDQQGNPITEDDAKIFAGCRVNAKVKPWASGKSKYGNMLGFNLLAVQFIECDEDQEDAQPFGEGNISFEEAVDGFDVEEDDDDMFGDDD